MGNCVFKGFPHNDDISTIMVRVVTSNGGIMELYPPVTVECITNQFPGHGIFPHSRPGPSGPMLHSDDLLPGHLYYLLPLHYPYHTTTTAAAAKLTPYRMSTYEKTGPAVAMPASSEADVFPRYNSGRSGVWKVKLVISPEQLSEILSQESRTEALIESVRTVAKCGNGNGNGVPSSVANSDQWSVCSSSGKGSMSEKMGIDG